MDKYKRLLKDTALFAFGNFASKVLVFLLVPLYTNVLSTAEYGIADLLTATVNLLYPILTLSITEATLRFAFDKDVKRNEILTISLSLIFSSTFLLLLFTFLVRHINETLYLYWGYFIAVYVTELLRLCFSNYSRGVGKVKLFAVQGVVQTAVLIFSNIIFLLVVKIGLEGYLLSIIFSNICAVLVMFFAGHYRKDIFNFSFNRALLKDMLKYCIPLIPTIIAWWVILTSSKYMVVWLIDLSASGIYGVAYKIPTILSVLTSLFTQAWQIAEIKNFGEKDNEHFVSTIYRYFNIFSLFCALFILFCTKFLAGLLFAKDYYIAWTCVPALLVAYLFSGLSGFLASIFSAAKRTNVLFVSTCVGALLNIVLNLYFIPNFGIVGAAYATMIGFAVTFLIRLALANKIVKIQHSFPKDTFAYTALILCAVVYGNDIAWKYFLLVLVFFVFIVLYSKELVYLIKLLYSKLICRGKTS